MQPLANLIRTALGRMRHVFGTIPGKITYLGFALGLIFFFKTLFLWAVQYDIEWKLDRLHVLVVDYDRGHLGIELNKTYQALQGPTFPTFLYVNPDDYLTTHDIEGAIASQVYWGAFYISDDASPRLRATWNGTEQAVSEAGGAVLSYVWNEANYPMVAAWIKTALKQASDDLRLRVLSTDFAPFGATVGTQQPLSIADLQIKLGAISKLLQASEETVCAGKALGHGAFNHLAIIALVMASDAFLQTLNRNVLPKSGIRGKKRMGLYYSAGTAYSCWLGLVFTTSPWLLRGRAGDQLDFSDFMPTWMVLWLGSLTLFSVSCAIRNVRLQPILTRSLAMLWLVVNAASAFVPIEISPIVFRWNWALPGHATYRLLIRTWCRAGTWEDAIGFVTLISWLGLGALGTWISTKSEVRKWRKENRPQISD